MAPLKGSCLYNTYVLAAGWGGLTVPTAMCLHHIDNQPSLPAGRGSRSKTRGREAPAKRLRNSWLYNALKPARNTSHKTHITQTKTRT